MTKVEGRALQVDDLRCTPVDHYSPIPLYHQIELDLRAMVQAGKLLPDDILPPEVELCKTYGVGRHTVRMALARLSADRIIKRYAGRGTFITRQQDRVKVYLDQSFTQQMADIGLRAHSKILHTASGKIDSETPSALWDLIGLSCYTLTRLRYGDNQPVGLQTTIIMTELCSGIEYFDFSTLSLYDVLLTEYKLNVTKITHTITAVVADATQARLLEISKGAPLLLVNTSAYLEKGDLIEYTSSFYRADRYEYSTTHTFVAGSR